MAQRWSSSFVPSISSIKPERDEDGNEITVEQQYKSAIANNISQIAIDADDAAKAVKNAKKLGTLAANRTTESKDILKNYKN